MALQFDVQQRNDLADHLVEVHRNLLPAVVLEHRPNAVDHLARPLARVRYALESRFYLVEVRWRLGKPAQTCATTQRDRCQWLVDFMRYRSRHLPRRRQAGHACKLGLSRAQFFLRAFVLGNVDHRSDKHFLSGFRCPRHRTVAPHHRAVLATVLFDNNVMIDLALLEFRESGPRHLAPCLNGNVQRREVPQFLDAVAEHVPKCGICCQIVHVLIESLNTDAGRFKYRLPARLARFKHRLGAGTCKRLGHDFADDRYPGDEFGRPFPRGAKRAEADCSDDATTNWQRYDKHGTNAGAAIIFRGGRGLRRDVFVRPNDDGAAGTKLLGKPTELRWYRAARRRLHAFYRRRAQKVLLVVIDEFPEGAAVKAEKLEQPLERAFDFRDDLIAGNICETGRQIRKQAFKYQELFQRGIRGAGGWRASSGARNALRSGGSRLRFWHSPLGLRWNQSISAASVSHTLRLIARLIFSLGNHGNPGIPAEVPNGDVPSAVCGADAPLPIARRVAETTL